MESLPKSRDAAKTEYWRKQINNWKTSGLSQKQYCRSRSLALSTFCYWKKKINRPEPAIPKFYPLAIPTCRPESADAGLLVLVGTNQLQIKISSNFSQTTLKKLIATLEQL